MAKLTKGLELKLNYVKEVLKILATHDSIIFRGGTALSLAHGSISRFSEDIDVSILKPDQTKETKKEYLGRIRNDLIKQLNSLVWVDHLEVLDEVIEVHFNNPHDEHPGKGFSESKIILELPKDTWRTTEEIIFETKPPYKGADFSMKIMTEQDIYSDKASLITEKFSFSLNFEWAHTDKTSARHLYDCMILQTKYAIEENNVGLQRTINSFIRLDEKSIPIFKGADEKVVNRKVFFSMRPSKAWELFESELLSVQKEIKEVIEKIVYPNAQEWDIKNFIKKYKKTFLYIHNLINEKMKSKT